MIKLTKILEAIHIQQPQGGRPKPSDDEFKTIPTGTDPETGRKSWDVMYMGPDEKGNKRLMFANTYKTIKKLANAFEEVAKLPTYAKDGEMHTFARTLRTLEQKFKEYIIAKGKGV